MDMLHKMGFNSLLCSPIDGNGRTVCLSRRGLIDHGFKHILRVCGRNEKPCAGLCKRIDVERCGTILLARNNGTE